MSLLDLIFTGREQRKQDELDALLAAENQRDRERYGAAWFTEAEGNRKLGAVDVAEEYSDAFREGAMEGLHGMQDGVKKTLTETLRGALGFVPWWAWLGLAGYAAWHFGFLRRKN